MVSIPFILTTKKILKMMYKNLLIIQTISGSNIQNWSISLGIQSCGGMKNIKFLQKLIKIQDDWTIKNFSKKQSKFLNKNFLIVKYKKFWTKRKVHRNLWTGSRKGNFQLLKLSSTMVDCTLKSKTFGKPSMNCLTQHNIDRSTIHFQVKSLTNLNLSSLLS